MTGSGVATGVLRRRIAMRAATGVPMRAVRLAGVGANARRLVGSMRLVLFVVMPLVRHVVSPESAL
jgi:hypothetical protein